MKKRTKLLRFLLLFICLYSFAGISYAQLINRQQEENSATKKKPAIKQKIKKPRDLPSQRVAPVINECDSVLFFCSDTTFNFDYRDGEGGCRSNSIYLYYYFRVGSDSLSNLVLSSPDSLRAYGIYGPYESAVSNVCNLDTSDVEINYTTTTTAYSYSTGTDVGILPEGYYYLVIVPDSCNSQVNFDATGDLMCNDSLACENCIGSFAPEPGKKYVISAWVKEDGASPTKTSYTYPKIYIDFPSISTTLGPYTAEGVIIDGWQKIEEEFTISLATTDMKLRLECATGDCYFDDLRIFPYDGSMKTYVYDPATLRLVAELDERHYATFYEYDEEGKLVRVKKETERGIMTIQENKTSIIKQ